MATWDEMTPAERNQLVAERVAGYERHEIQRDEDGIDVETYWTKGDDGWWYGCDEDDMPHYSQDIGAAFTLLEPYLWEINHIVIGGLFKVRLIQPNGPWVPVMVYDDDVTLPRAICRVVLRVHGVDV